MDESEKMYRTLEGFCWIDVIAQKKRLLRKVIARAMSQT
jgi:hypothetical protein